MPPYKAVIFDMDGTLIEPMLDFDAVRADLSIPPGQDILDAISRMEPTRSQRVADRLIAVETAAAHKATLHEDAPEMLCRLRRAGLKTGLLTRNSRPAVDIVFERTGLPAFELIRSREDGMTKPDPAGIIEACAVLGTEPRETLCVGDYIYDIIAANAAGAVSVLMATSARWREFKKESDFVIHQLSELEHIVGNGVS